MNVKQRLKLLAVLSVIAIISLTLANVYKEYCYMEKLKHTKELVSLSKHISTMMDNIQNERSISAVFIQSRGSYLVDELDLQRKKTDLQIAAYQDLIKEYQLFDKSTIVKDDISSIEKSFKNLSKIRNKIDRFKLHLDEMLIFYDSINRPMLDIISINADQSPSGDISKDLSAYYFFLKAKEFASKQKAILSAAFISEKFTGAIFDQTISLIAKEQSYFDVFENLAPKELLTLYHAKENLEVFKDSYSFSQNAIKSAKEGIFDMDLETWFGMIAKKSNILKDIDKKAIEKIEQDIKQTPSIALYIAVAGLIFLIIILFVINGINKEISRRIHSFDWIIDNK